MSDSLRSLNYLDLQQCMHCGMCLPTCPTYTETQNERNGPRGRISLMRAIADGGSMSPRPSARKCTFASAASPARPPAPPGCSMDIFSRQPGRDRALRRSRQPETQRLSLHPSQRAFHPAPSASLCWSSFVALSGIWRASHLSGSQAQSSPAGKAARPRSPDSRRAGEVFPRADPARDGSGPQGRPPDRLRAGHRARRREPRHRRGARRQRCEVHTPPVQPCCGSLHAHNGEPDTARLLARRMLDLINPSDYDAIITNAPAAVRISKRTVACWQTIRPIGNVRKPGRPSSRTSTSGSTSSACASRSPPKGPAR